MASLVMTVVVEGVAEARELIERLAAAYAAGQVTDREVEQMRWVAFWMLKVRPSP
jgi:DNA-binding FadR family transcriptional regulator